MKRTIITIAACLVVKMTLAYTYYVAYNGPNIYPFTNWAQATTNIYTAVNLCQNLDTVLVSNGVYTLTGQIYIVSTITLKSVNGPTVTIIDGNGAVTAQRCIYCQAGAQTIDGFTIQNGLKANDQGGGLYADNFSGAIRNCIIRNNTTLGPYQGGGIYWTYGIGGTIQNCLIVGNKGGSTGGGGTGGGVYSYGEADGYGPIIINCTIVSNTADYAGGLRCFYYGRVINSIIYDNFAGGASNYDIVDDSHTNVLVYNSCVAPLFAAGTGNIDSDPQFLAWTNENFRLATGSRCINTGTNQSWMEGTYDLDGHHRQDKFSGQVDMGCYEYVPSGTMVTFW